MSLRLHGDVARPAFGLDSLNETERRVAELVPWGYSNKEIGQWLYMSHRIVDGGIGACLGSRLVCTAVRPASVDRGPVGGREDTHGTVLRQTGLPAL
jgi:hypothetical protein